MIYPFRLDFTGGGGMFASFPFLYEGVPVPGVLCGISSRQAGDLGNRARRQALGEALDIPGEKWRLLRQVHSRQVLTADEEGPPPGTEGDGLVSADRSLCLGVTLGDCLPVFLYDTEGGCFGVVHSGWRGTGIVLEALRLMRERWGTRPEGCAAVLGPCIQACCYRVDGERAALFRSRFGEGESPLGPVVEEREGGLYLGLQAANALLLSGAGVRHIACCGDCTFTEERLGSYRREGPDYTRMLGWAGGADKRKGL